MEQRTTLCQSSHPREQAGISPLLFLESDSCTQIWFTTLATSGTIHIQYPHRGEADKILSG